MMRRRLRVGLAIAALAAIGWTLPLRAQAPAVTGRVVDEQGGAVAAAEVRLLRVDGAAARTARTDASGTYRFDGLNEGLFILQIEGAGFRRHVSSVTLSDRSATLDEVTLTVAGVEDSIVVTGAGLPQSTSEVSKAVSIVTQQEIAERNEATLIEIVRFTPGVQVRDNGGPGQFATVRIRGVRPDAGAILVDGMRMRDASTTQGDAGSFMSNLNFVGADRVEVLRGSGSALFGTNAVGGAVNIVTAAGGSPFRGDAQVEGGSLGAFRARGVVNGGALDDELAYSVSGLQWNVADGLDGDDAARSTGWQGMLRYQFSPLTSLTGRVYGSNDRVAINSSPTAAGIPAANVPTAIIVDAIPVTPEAIERFNAGQPLVIGNATYIPGRNDPDSRRTSWFATNALQFQHVQHDRLSWQGSYQRVHTNRVFRNGPAGPGFQAAAESYGNYVGDIDTADGRAILLPASWLDITAGYEFEREAYFDRQDNNLPGASRVATQTRIAQHANTGYAAANMAFAGRRLQLSLAGRLQTFALKPVELSAVGTDNAYARTPPDSPPRALTGDVSLAYMIAASNTKLRTHTGNAYRAPALYERYGGGFSTSPTTGAILFTAYGDPRLEPDRYRTFDAGIDQRLWRDRVSASATFFYIDVQSLTAFDSSGRINPATDPFGRSLGYLNGSGGFSRGLEVSADVRPASSVRLAASYTHTRAETEQDVTVPGFFLVPAVFEHTATFVMTNRWTDRIDSTFDLFHAGESYGSFSAGGRPRAYRYPSFTKAALIARIRLSPGGEWAVRAYVKVDNMFDDTYYQGGWQALGRTALAGVSIGF